MKKIITAILTITMLASLTACNAENSSNDTSSRNISSDSDSSQNSDTVSSENSENTESTPVESRGEPMFFSGLNGETIYSNEITTVIDSDFNETTIDNITPENFSQAICEGFCYLSEPCGISRTELDNPDSWAGSLNCTDIPQGILRPEYKRLNVGDTFCGLTIKKASTKFLGSGPNNFWICNVEFDGELTLTGYIHINHDGDYAVGEGDLQFLIDDKCSILPGNPDTSESYVSPEPHTVFKYNGFYYDNGTDEPSWCMCCNEYGLIYLGNISTCTADLSDIGTSNSKYDFYRKVKVKIENLKIGYYPELSNMDYRYYADLIELDPIE